MSIPVVNTGPDNVESGEDTVAVTVVVPTYRRPAEMTRCIQSLLQGTLQPAEIIVVGRRGDTETEQALQLLSESVPFLRSAWVETPGHVPPVEAGIRSASAPIVAVVDDDVTVWKDWLAKLVQQFSDPTVGVVGGRVLFAGLPQVPKGHPGQISWYGKAWGNLGSVTSEVPFEVDHVMEGNWSWRRALLASLYFDPILNFDDAMMFGTDLCFQAKRKGFRILYESRAVVFHHNAPRAPELDRADQPRRIFSYCRNYTYIMMRRLPWWRRPIFLAWWFLVGERRAWGLAALVAEMLMRRGKLSVPLAPALKGKIEGLRLWFRSANSYRE